jgi:hypothetical protein
LRNLLLRCQKPEHTPFFNITVIPCGHVQYPNSNSVVISKKW